MLFSVWLPPNFGGYGDVVFWLALTIASLVEHHPFLNLFFTWNQGNYMHLTTILNKCEKKVLLLILDYEVSTWFPYYRILLHQFCDKLPIES
jgi:hypothetical protein